MGQNISQFKELHKNKLKRGKLLNNKEIVLWYLLGYRCILIPSAFSFFPGCSSCLNWVKGLLQVIIWSTVFMRYDISLKYHQDAIDDRFFTAKTVPDQWECCHVMWGNYYVWMGLLIYAEMYSMFVFLRYYWIWYFQSMNNNVVMNWVRNMVLVNKSFYWWTATHANSTAQKILMCTEWTNHYR